MTLLGAIGKKILPYLASLSFLATPMAKASDYQFPVEKLTIDELVTDSSSFNLRDIDVTLLEDLQDGTLDMSYTRAVITPFVANDQLDKYEARVNSVKNDDLSANVFNFLGTSAIMSILPEQEVHELIPNSGDATTIRDIYKELGWEFIRQERFQEAIPYVATYTAMSQDVLGDHELALCFQRTNDPKEKRFLRNSLAENLNQLSELHALSILDLETGDSEEALYTLNLAIPLAENDPSCNFKRELYNNRGSIHHEAGRLQQAASDYEQAKSLNLFEIYSSLGAIYYNLDDKKKAVEPFEAALEIRPDDTKTLKLLYTCHIVNEDLPECADVALQRAALTNEVDDWYNAAACYTNMQDCRGLNIAKQGKKATSSSKFNEIISMLGQMCD